MHHLTEKSDNGAVHASSLPLDEKATAVILLELDSILKSQPFRTSSRSKQFLSYVVHKALNGQTENLKERTIGVEVFQRDPDYATGEDPVVRVNAGEVRRRLEQYYYAAPEDTPVRIEIPIGSYAPEFRWTSVVLPEQEHLSEADVHVIPDHEPSHLEKAAVGVANRPYRWLGLTVASCFGLALIVGLVVFGVRSHKQSESAVDLFWAPAFKTPRPVLICLAHTVVYRPTLDLYERYAKSHPGTFDTEYQRLSEELPLDPKEKMEWKDMEMYPDFGVGSGDIYAETAITSLLTQKGKTNELRIGNDCSFEDIRNSPSVALGAFNNRWTQQMASNLHFAFDWNHRLQQYPRIKENTASGRIWAAEVGPHYRFSADYGIVTRLVDAGTGQLLISAAGLGTAGTQATGELISDPQYLEEALRNAPKDWNKKDLQIVVRTKVTDAIPGPPQVVATYFW